MGEGCRGRRREGIPLAHSGGSIRLVTMSSSAGRIAILVAITMSTAARTPDAVRPLRLVCDDEVRPAP